MNEHRNSYEMKEDRKKRRNDEREKKEEEEEKEEEAKRTQLNHDRVVVREGKTDNHHRSSEA